MYLKYKCFNIRTSGRCCCTSCSMKTWLNEKHGTFQSNKAMHWWPHFCYWQFKAPNALEVYNYSLKNKNKNKKNQQAPLFGTPFLELMVYNGSNREDSHVVPLFKQDNHAATEMYSFWTMPFPTQNDPQLTLRTGRSSPSTKHSIAVLLKSDRAKSPAELPGSSAAHRDTAPTSAVRDLWDINSQPSVGCSCLVSQLCWSSEHWISSQSHLAFQKRSAVVSQWPISKYAKQAFCSISELQLSDSVVECLLAFIKNALRYSHAAPGANKHATIPITPPDPHLSPPAMFSTASILPTQNAHPYVFYLLSLTYI